MASQKETTYEGPDESFNPPSASTPIESSNRDQDAHDAGMQHSGGSQPGPVKQGNVSKNFFVEHVRTGGGGQRHKKPLI